MFLAAMLEADVVPVLTGVVAHFGYVRVGPAVLAAMAGAFAGDYVWFCVGVYYSKTIRNSRFYRRAGQVPERLIRRLGLWQIPASHLIYGTRISTMMFWGVQRISTLKFALVDVSGCFVLTRLTVHPGLCVECQRPFGCRTREAGRVASARRSDLWSAPVLDQQAGATIFAGSPNWRARQRREIINSNACEHLSCTSKPLCWPLSSL